MKENKVVSLEEYRCLAVKKTPPTVLIIEDDEIMRRALCRLFEDEGYKVLSAADGTQLSRVLDDSGVDIIILDIGLPWINGFELATLLKDHDQLKELPLIFISGRTDEEDIKKAFDVGADDFIKKPFDIEQMKAAVSTLMKLHHDK
ncbi:MAG: response regulator [Bdellovibrionales bacterium]|nr:response regulator [Bdellovibrionales bacterium]